MELKEKIFEDDNALDVLRKMKDGLEHQVLELKGKMVEDEKLLDVLKSKNGELEYEVLEFRKLKEKWEEDTNELCGIREKNAELENEVLELKKLKKQWLNDSNALEELRSKVRVSEDDKKSLAEIEIKNGQLKESVNNNLATISKLKNENNNLYMKFYGLLERVAKMEDDTKLLMSVDASWGGKNEADPPADPMVAEFGNDTVQAASLPRNEDAQPQNIRGKDAQGASSGI
jgi:DNA repair exonuclease SbcCD ATPase subunit